jgi:hypothetical protein
LNSEVEVRLNKISTKLEKMGNAGMITKLMDMLEQWHRRSGRLVGDNVYCSPFPIAKAAFVYAQYDSKSNRRPENWLRSTEALLGRLLE